ncbi:hypothetical protein OV079_18175 [Nannocystis pusilla]|uniref:Uncharacterized protein n=1 Tax=Nannocystis pusilla TaxID=889268 RepID=A0A9X3ENN1_9BACT|nr:hypothetical protein [Nannocystis pusilla]MCY1007442.1 hypothetical protein [Nannocystis pusilla]
MQLGGEEEAERLRREDAEPRGGAAGLHRAGCRADGVAQGGVGSEHAEAEEDAGEVDARVEGVGGGEAEVTAIEVGDDASGGSDDGVRVDHGRALGADLDEVALEAGEPDDEVVAARRAGLAEHLAAAGRIGVVDGDLDANWPRPA